MPDLSDLHSKMEKQLDTIQLMDKETHDTLKDVVDSLSLKVSNKLKPFSHQSPC